MWVSMNSMMSISNGYLVDGKCVFGAEVFVYKETRIGKGECLSRIESPITYKHIYIWKVENFSKLADPFYFSEPFTAAGQKWYIC